MKISNSKKELARIISENGGWKSDKCFAAQDACGTVNVYECKPVFSAGSSGFGHGGGRFTEMFKEKKITNWHQTILSREEYFHLYPAPDADGWIEWKGGECPVENGSLIDVKKTDGSNELAVHDPQDRIWNDKEHRKCIVAYRLHKPEQAKPEFCESVTRSIPEPETKPTIEHLASDYRNAKDCADSKQHDADAAKADAEAKLKALELACEALGLIVSPITEKQEHGLEITDWRDLRVGDEISVQHMKNVYSKSEVLVVGDSEVAVRNHVGARKTVNLDAVDWKFIRRP